MSKKEPMKQGQIDAIIKGYIVSAISLYQYHLKNPITAPKPP